MSKRILIIEDNAAVARLLTRLFERAGHPVMAIDRAAELPEALMTGPFHAAMIDCDLPDGVDGVVAALEVRRSQPAVRIFLMSGQPANLERARAAGFGSLLPKPFELPFEDLLRRIIAP